MLYNENVISSVVFDIDHHNNNTGKGMQSSSSSEQANSVTLTGWGRVKGYALFR